MTATIAIGDKPSYGSAYRAAIDATDAGICAAGDNSVGYTCTAPAGHLSGDVPHVAIGALSGVLAIWDGRGREVVAEHHGEEVANIGATL